MFKIKSKLKDAKQKKDFALRKYFRKHTDFLYNKLRLRSRIRIVNRWARKNPRIFGSCYAAIAIFLLTVTVSTFTSGNTKKTQDPLGLSEMPDFSKQLKFVNKTVENNNILKKEIAEFHRQGLIMSQELDSLLKLTHKCHEDSVRINSLYNILIENFKINDNDKP